jgi:hypothetical protein
MYTQATHNIGPEPGATLGLGLVTGPIAKRVSWQRKRKGIGELFSSRKRGKGFGALGQDDSEFDTLMSDYGGSGSSTIDLFGGSSVVPSIPGLTVSNSSLNTAGSYQVGSNTYNPNNPLNDITGSSGSSDFSSALNSVIAQAGNIAKLVLTPGGSYSVYNPLTGQTISYQGTGQASTVGIPGLSSLSGTDILLLAGGVILIMMMGSHK